MNGALPDEQIRRAGRVGDPALILGHPLPRRLRVALLHSDNDRSLFGHGGGNTGGFSTQPCVSDRHALRLEQGRQRAFALAEFPALFHGRALGLAAGPHRVADESVTAGIHRHAAHGLRPVGAIAVGRACAAHGDGRATLHTLATDGIHALRAIAFGHCSKRQRARNQQQARQDSLVDSLHGFPDSRRLGL